MSHSHNHSWRPRKFRAFVTNKYYENRDEYAMHGQRQPHSFDEYWRKNLGLLKDLYRGDKYHIIGDSDVKNSISNNRKNRPNR